MYSKGVDIQSHNVSGIPDAVNTAKSSDAVIIVLGDYARQPNGGGNTCGEWADNNDLDPPGEQYNLLNQVVNAVKGDNIPVVVVLITGRPYTFANGDPSNKILNDISLLINAYRPGQMGGPAIRDVIMGDTENSGKCIT